jgi:hypothetical protein
MVIMWELSAIADVNEIVPVCPFKHSFKECHDLKECSLYSEARGCIAYDVRGRFY